MKAVLELFSVVAAVASQVQVQPIKEFLWLTGTNCLQNTSGSEIHEYHGNELCPDQMVIPCFSPLYCGQINCIIRQSEVGGLSLLVFVVSNGKKLICHLFSDFINGETEAKGVDEGYLNHPISDIFAHVPLSDL